MHTQNTTAPWTEDEVLFGAKSYILEGVKEKRTVRTLYPASLPVQITILTSQLERLFKPRLQQDGKARRPVH